MSSRIIRLAAPAAILLALALPAAAVASPFDPSGVLRLIRKPHAGFNASQSGNWFGYGQGTLEQGGKLFTAISADWRVPRATRHQRGHAAQSATWIGIGGGCIDAGCLVTDESGLIQSGTEQDVSASGKASYSAWWELVPVPAITITGMKVGAGDRMHASIATVSSSLVVWKITLQDRTRHETFTTTLLYPSSHATAEWIEETPLTIGGGSAGFSSLPNLTETPFDNATVNGKSAHLKRSEQIQLYANSTRIGTPSVADRGADGFGACAWSRSCRAPLS